MAASIRCIVAGPSGCSKTNLLLNLLLKKGYFSFDRLHLYSKSLRQEKYTFLQDWAETLKEVVKKEVASFHSSLEDIIPVKSDNSNERSIMVFDDVMLENQGPIEWYFTHGLHGSADCFCLTQNYFQIPEQAICDNCNLVV